MFCSCVAHISTLNDVVEAHAQLSGDSVEQCRSKGGYSTMMSLLIATYPVSTFDANRKRPSVPHIKKDAAPVASLSSSKNAKKDTTSQGRGAADTVQWSVSKQKTMIAGVVVKLLNPYLNTKKITSKVLCTLMHACTVCIIPSSYCTYVP